MVLGLLMLSLMATRHSFMTALISNQKEMWLPSNEPFLKVVQIFKTLAGQILAEVVVFNLDVTTSSRKQKALIMRLNLVTASIASFSQKQET